jgi:hypothetical protein
MFQGWREAGDIRQPTRKKRYEFLIVMMNATVLLAGAAGGRVEAPDAFSSHAPPERLALS